MYKAPAESSWSTHLYITRALIHLDSIECPLPCKKARVMCVVGEAFLHLIRGADVASEALAIIVDAPPPNSAWGDGPWAR